MKKLYLVRHAKSDRTMPELPDFERPLNLRGRMDAPLMGDLLKKLHVHPDLIVTSPANRAMATARLMADYLNYPLKNIQVEEGLYETWREDLLAIVQSLAENAESVMMIGHNPGLQLLAEHIAGFDYENFPTCGVAGIELNIDSWKKIGQNTGRIMFFEFPKKFRPAPGK